MSAAGNGINSAMKPVKDFGNKEVKEAGQRYQGRYAKKYDPSDTRFNRGLNRFRSGHFIPSKRSQRLAIAKGDKYQQEQDEMSLALLKRDGEKAMAGYATFFRNDDGTLVKVRRNAQGQMLDKDNNVTDDAKEAALRMQNTAGQFLDVNGQVVAKREDAAYVTTEDEAEAGTRTLTGVQAMKQRWVDLMDDDKADASVKKMAARQLVATSSWPEIQGSFTTKGRRVIDTDDWSKSITTSPDDYPRVLRSRVDATPHIDDGAKKALAIEIERRSNNNLPPLTEIQQRRFLSQNRVQYSIEKQMGNEDFATQSDGYWAEVARMSTVTRDMTSDEAQRALQIQQHLRDRFKAIHDIGGTAPQQLLGHLMDGGPLQKNVQQALGGIDLSTYIGSGPPHPPTTQGPVVPTP